MVGWYHGFIDHIALVAEPLYALTSPKRKYQPTPKAIAAFEELKALFLKEVVLAHPIFGRPFLLRTDASVRGVGAYISQLDDEGNERVISFASKIFNSAETNYSTPEQECYGIIFGLEKFREYLDGHEFVLQTDNQALTYLESMKNTNRRLMRWSWKLQEWSPFIQHIKGRDNCVADFLSRNPVSDPLDVDKEHDYMFPPIQACHLQLKCKMTREVLLHHQQQHQQEMTKFYSSPEFCKILGITYRHQTDSDGLLPVI
jgi:hypothetical protein